MLTCPECGKQNVTTFHSPLERDISVFVPVRDCQDCGFKYLDHEAEDIIEKAQKLSLTPTLGNVES